MAKFEVDLPDGMVVVEASDEYDAYQKALNQTRKTFVAQQSQQVPEKWGDVVNRSNWVSLHNQVPNL